MKQKRLEEEADLKQKRLEEEVALKQKRLEEEAALKQKALEEETSFKHKFEMLQASQQVEEAVLELQVLHEQKDKGGYISSSDESIDVKPHLHGRLLAARINILPFFFLKSRRPLTRRKIHV